MLGHLHPPLLCLGSAGPDKSWGAGPGMLHPLFRCLPPQGLPSWGRCIPSSVAGLPKTGHALENETVSPLSQLALLGLTNPWDTMPKG